MVMGGNWRGDYCFFLRRIRRLRILFYFRSHPPLRYPVGTSTFFIIVSFFSVRFSCGGQEIYTTQFSIYRPLRDHASCHLAIGMEHDEVGDLGSMLGEEGEGTHYNTLDSTAKVYPLWGLDLEGIIN